MKLLWIGRHVLNVEAIVRAVPDGAGPGLWRLWMRRSDTIDLDAQESADFTREIAQLVPHPRPQAGGGKPPGP